MEKKTAFLGNYCPEHTQSITVSQKESEWEKEFDNEFDCVLWWGCRNEDGTQKHGYETDCGDELKTFIRKVIASREKQIAEEVAGSVYAAFFSEAGEDDFEEFDNWRKNVLPGIILNH